MLSVDDKLRTFLSKYLISVNNLVKWNEWLLIPVLSLKARLHYPNDVGVVSWISNVGYHQDTNTFALIATNTDVNMDSWLYYLHVDLRGLNAEFDGTMVSLIRYLDLFNRFENEDFRKVAYVKPVIWNSGANLDGAKRLVRIDTIKLV